MSTVWGGFDLKTYIEVKMIMVQKILLMYPPGKLYQRGEDRSQGNIEDSTATSIRACNDLGYSAAVLLQRGYKAQIWDYQTQKMPLKEIYFKTVKYEPNMIMLSVTNATIYEDIEFASRLKTLVPDVKIVLKGSIFFDPEPEMLRLLDFSSVDYLIGGECELAIADIADYEFYSKGTCEQISNILYKGADGELKKTRFYLWHQNLDEIPFPARNLMNNSLYKRPDINETMATIQTSRGCAGNCIYCLSPKISGKHVRFRSIENIMQELMECYNVYHIKNFFFKADTFTINPQWVKELCTAIMMSQLNGKIAFTANSRVAPLNKETLQLMKQAGCFAIAFGYESGSDVTLQRICKGTTVAQNIQAAKWAKEVGISVYGFFMIGFPWETANDLEATRRHIFDLSPDFIEVHVALPYYGTELHQMCREGGTLTKETLGSDYFHSSTNGTQTLSMNQLLSFRRNLINEYYFRPTYILKRLKDCVENPCKFLNYLKYGLRNIEKR